MNIIDSFIEKSKKVRATIARPLLVALTKMGVTANGITFLRGLSGPVYLALFLTYPVIAYVQLLVSLLLDTIDGALARYQKKSSDTGKFWDVLFDHTNYVIPVFGFLFFSQVDIFSVGVHLLLVPVLYLLATIYTSEYTKTDWIIHPYYRIIYFKPIGYVAIGLLLFHEYHLINVILLGLNIAMGATLVFYLFKLYKRWS